MTAIDLLAREHELRKQDQIDKARKGLLNFTCYVFKDYEVNWHHRIIARALNKVVSGELKRVIFTIPPRHGKTTLISHHLPAFMLGLNPRTKIISASYGQSLASRNNRDVQRIIESPSYQQLFPATRLASQATKADKGSWLKNATMFETVGYGGCFISAGVGSSLTGFGGTCLPAGSMVTTENGLIDIAHLAQLSYDSPRVLSYNHTANTTEWQPVKASRVFHATEIYEIETVNGRKIRCTGDHHIYFGKRGYGPANSACVGDEITVSPSCRRRQKKQFTCQSSDAMQWVPPKAPSIESDAVSVVRRIRAESQPVYDIQVAGNSNFFADGILIHNCLICDDPIRNREEADSVVYRERTYDWYTSTFSTRAEKDAAIVIVQTRWHEGDLTGLLLKLAAEDPKADQWTVINLPAICELTTDVDPREPGEPLWPGKYNLDTLGKIKASVGSRNWTALYQQRPAPEGGAIIKREWWRYYKAIPEGLDTYIQAWDLTFTGAKGSDFVVGVVLARKGANIYLLDLVRGRMTFTVAAFRRLSAKWPTASTKLVELAANGHALVDSLQKELPGIIGVKPLGSKVARVNAVSPRIEAGNVWLPDPSIAPWVHDFVEEWTAFPTSVHDDQVDAMVHGLIRFSGIAPSDWAPISLTGSNHWKY